MTVRVTATLYNFKPYNKKADMRVTVTGVTVWKNVAWETGAVDQK